jgi:hypothetical protein
VSVATKTTVEAFRCQPESYRATAAMTALIRQAGVSGVELEETTAYRGDADWLLIWGPGGPDRFPAMAAQRAQGKRIVALDLAYWQRESKIRISIDAAHPQAWVMRRDWPRTRFTADHVPVANGWDSHGPIVVAGIGRKARAQYGQAVEAWEAAMIAECRAKWTQPLLYRRKQLDVRVPDGVSLTSDAPIDRVLAGASLLITWHSNVAVDAIRMGIPVVCHDGAAAAVCSADLPDAPTPLPVEVRDRFLRNLAWFQWNPVTEGRQAWAWLQELLA